VRDCIGDTLERLAIDIVRAITIGRGMAGSANASALNAAFDVRAPRIRFVVSAVQMTLAVARRSLSRLHSASGFAHPSSDLPSDMGGSIAPGKAHDRVP
jgi:hypothetical protein